MQELLDSPNEKDPANGPPNQMCAAATTNPPSASTPSARLSSGPGSAVSLPRCGCLAVASCPSPILRAWSGRYVTNKSAYEKKVREIAAKFPAP